MGPCIYRQLAQIALERGKARAVSNETRSWLAILVNDGVERVDNLIKLNVDELHHMCNAV